MDDWSKGEVVALFGVIFTVIGIFIAATKPGSRLRASAVVLLFAVITLFVIWLVGTVRHKQDMVRLPPPEETPQPSPPVSPVPSPLFSPSPKFSPTLLPTATPTQAPTPVRLPTPRPTVTPTPVLQPRPAPQEPPNTARPGMVTLSFTLLDHAEPVTGARVTFSGGGFSTTAYTRNGRATATVPCGVPNMWITFEYGEMRNAAPIVRGLKCQRCHFEAGPIDLGAFGVQYLNVRCG